MVRYGGPPSALRLARRRPPLLGLLTPRRRYSPTLHIMAGPPGNESTPLPTPGWRHQTVVPIRRSGGMSCQGEGGGRASAGSMRACSSAVGVGGQPAQTRIRTFRTQLQSGEVAAVAAAESVPHSAHRSTTAAADLPVTVVIGGDAAAQIIAPSDQLTSRSVPGRRRHSIRRVRK